MHAFIFLIPALTNTSPQRPCVRLPRGDSESAGFEHTKKKVRKRRSHFSTHSSTIDLKIMLFVKCEIIHGENHA